MSYNLAHVLGKYQRAQNFEVFDGKLYKVDRSDVKTFNFGL